MARDDESGRARCRLHDAASEQVTQTFWVGCCVKSRSLLLSFSLPPMFAIVVIMWENEAMRYFRLVARLGKERGQHVHLSTR